MGGHACAYGCQIGVEYVHARLDTREFHDLLGKKRPLSRHLHLAQLEMAAAFRPPDRVPTQQKHLHENQNPDCRP